MRAGVVSCAVITMVSSLHLGQVAGADKLLPAQVNKTEQGLRVTRSYSDKLEKGDLITHIDNRRITAKSADAVSRHVMNYSGDTIGVVVDRNGESIEIKRLPLVEAREWKALVDATVEREKKARFESRVQKGIEQREQWLKSTTFTFDGRDWTRQDIEDHNRPLLASVLKAQSEHRDTDLGKRLDTAERVLARLQEFEGLQEGGELLMGTYESHDVYTSARSFLLQYKDKAWFAPSVRDLFILSEAGLILVPCRDGKLRRMQDVWDRAWQQLVE